MDFWDAYKLRNAWQLEHSKDIIPIIKTAFGPSHDYYDDGYDSENTQVPGGSEGTLKYEVIRSGDASSISWGFISIYGDLRDFGNINQITSWITDSLDKLTEFGIWVRQSSIIIGVEFLGDFHFTVSINNENQKYIITEIAKRLD